MSRRTLLGCALPALGALLLASSPAGAWSSYGVTWPGHVVDYRINPANLDVTNAAAVTAIRFGADAWTNQTQAAFRFNYLGTSTNTSTNNDGLNLVLFRNITPPSPLPSSALAVTYIWSSGSTILDVNIVFFDTKTFITGSTACSGSRYYIEDVAIHEFGHALGLDHATATAATMYPSAPACNQTWKTLHSDDILGVETLYPCTAASQCNDANVCTTDKCQSSKCVRTAITGCCTTNAQCNDSNACTTDKCQTNACTHAAIAGCCTTNAQCNDSNACTTDKCQSNACTHAAVAGCCTTNAQCNDSNACTTDKCQGSACTNTAIADCCTTNAQCNDSNACTTDKCQSNACTNAAIADCCTTNAQCNDSDACTTDKCESNACTHAVIAGCDEPQNDAGVDGSASDAQPDVVIIEVDGAPSDATADATAWLPDARLDAVGDPDPRSEAGADSAGTVPESDSAGGCGCGVRPRSDVHAWAAAIGALALVLVRSRRRRNG